MNNDNKKGRFYPIFFILLLIVITFMYASLASNFGVKMNNNKYLEPTDNPTTDDNKPDDKKDDKSDTSNNRGSSSSTPIKKDSVPVIEPSNINWQIEFENLEVDADSIEAITDAHILSNKTEVNYTIYLRVPGEKYSFDVDVVNNGNIDAKIYDTVLTGLNSTQMKYIKYKVTYKDGTTIKEGDTLLVGEKKKIHLEIEYLEDIEVEDLPDTDQELNLTYKVTYIEK